MTPANIRACAPLPPMLPPGSRRRYFCWVAPMPWDLTGDLAPSILHLALRHFHLWAAPLFRRFGIIMGGLHSPPLLLLVIMGGLQPSPLILLVIMVDLPSPPLPLGL